MRLLRYLRHALIFLCVVIIIRKITSESTRHSERKEQSLVQSDTIRKLRMKLANTKLATEILANDSNLLFYKPVRSRDPPPFNVGRRYLSFQPPGNGWNNQREAIENAIVLAKLLNRTLILHPMSPHDKVRDMKRGVIPGYLMYNELDENDIVPVSAFLDMEKLREIVSFIEYTKSHKSFFREFGNLNWKTVCHSVGFGYWIDRPTRNLQEETLIRQQKFSPKAEWTTKCPTEQNLYKHNPNITIIRAVSDLAEDNSEMLYFEQGTLFGISLRFFEYERAKEAQRWILEGLRYRPTVAHISQKVADIMGGKYNAIHVRRTDHEDRYLTGEHWIGAIERRFIHNDIPLYVATDETNLTYFRFLKDAGFKMYFSSSFQHLINLRDIPEVAHKDIVGIYEQYICTRAEAFVGSPRSTFSSFIYRSRGESPLVDGLLTRHILSLWLPSQKVKDKTENTNFHSLTEQI